MTDPIALWTEDGAAHGWTMPRVPGWWSWWGVRHVRAIWCRFGLVRHDRFYRSLGLIPTGYDRWVLFGIRHGLELKQDEPGGGE
jgi:hypothetical protein